MKCAVVTGGTRGIGRAISLSLAASGVPVYAIYARNRTAADSLASEAASRGMDIRPLRADLTSEDAVSACVSRISHEFSEVGVLVHCAASGVHRNSAELTSKHLAWTFNVNLFAVHH